MSDERLITGLAGMGYRPPSHPYGDEGALLARKADFEANYINQMSSAISQTCAELKEFGDPRGMTDMLTLVRRAKQEIYRLRALANPAPE